MKKCLCGKDEFKSGLCRGHYTVVAKTSSCKCGKKLFARGLCRAHYEQFRRALKAQNEGRGPAVRSCRSCKRVTGLKPVRMCSTCLKSPRIEYFRKKSKRLEKYKNTEIACLCGGKPRTSRPICRKCHAYILYRIGREKSGDLYKVKYDKYNCVCGKEISAAKKRKSPVCTRCTIVLKRYHSGKKLYGKRKEK